MLEAGLSSATSKRNPFDLITSIFGKKKPSVPDAEEQSTANVDAGSKNDSACRRCSTAPIVFGNEEDQCLAQLSLPKSPVSTRTKTLKEEVEALHLSRQDNPYLQQLEKLSAQEENSVPCDILSTSGTEKPIFHQGEWQFVKDGDRDLHQHLVRSPPPQFPQNVTHFMYSRANSPKHQNKDSPESPVSQQSGKDNRRSKILNPIQSKSGIDVLDPGVREVLEFQKQQLVGDSRCSLSSGPVDFNRSSPSSDALATPSHLLPITSRSQNRWSNANQRRSSQGGLSPVPTITGSLPGLTSSCLGLGVSAEVDAKSSTTLRPVRVGRTQSDGIVTSSSSVQDLFVSNSPCYLSKNGRQNFNYMFSPYVSKTGSQEPLLNASSKASSLDVG